MLHYLLLLTCSGLGIKKTLRPVSFIDCVFLRICWSAQLQIYLYHIVNVFIAILKLCPKMKYCPYKHAHVSKRTKISPAFVFCFSSEINPNERTKVAFLLKPSHLMAHRVK